LSDSLAVASGLRRTALVANVVYGAIDARVNREGPFMSERVRVPIVMAVWAAGLFGIAGVGFQKLTEYPELREAASEHVAVGASYNVLRVVAAVAVAALLVAVVPPVVSLLKSWPAGTLRFVAVPPLALAIWVGTLSVAGLLARGHSVHSVVNVTAVTTVVVLGFGVVGATAWTSSKVLRRAQVRAMPRLRAVSLPVVAGAMAATTLACLAWGVALRAGDPAEFTSDDGLLAISVPASWLATTLVMAGATAFAVIASRREMLAAAGQRTADATRD
jgi:hypothetical protein